MKHSQSNLISALKTQEDHSSLISQIKSIDFDLIDNLFTSYKENESLVATSKIEPIDHNIFEFGDQEKDEMSKDGLQIIADGKSAVLLMAGGQGTRLGFDHPKGMFNPGIPGVSSIFELFTLKVKRLNQIALESSGNIQEDYSYGPLKLIIMTNEETLDEIVEFFEKNDYFGYRSIIFFPQVATD